MYFKERGSLDLDPWQGLSFLRVPEEKSPLNFKFVKKSAQIILGKSCQEDLMPMEGGFILSGLTQRELLSTVYTKRGRI